MPSPGAPKDTQHLCWLVPGAAEPGRLRRLELAELAHAEDRVLRVPPRTTNGFEASRQEVCGWRRHQQAAPASWRSCYGTSYTLLAHIPWVCSGIASFACNGLQGCETAREETSPPWRLATRGPRTHRSAAARAANEGTCIRCRPSSARCSATRGWHVGSRWQRSTSSVPRTRLPGGARRQGSWCRSPVAWRASPTTDPRSTR